MKANTKLLIKQYENHQKKARLKKLILGSVILTPILIVVILFYPSQISIDTSNVSVKKEKLQTTTPPKEATPKRVAVTKEMQNEVIHITEKPQTKTVVQAVVQKPTLKLSLDTSFELHLNEQIQKPTKKPEQKLKAEESIEVSKQISITPSNIQPTISFSQQRSLEQLLQQYKQTSNDHNALQLSQYYFKKNNYEKSIEWALKCNAHNPKNSDSWFYFAKANIALGNIEDAKLALEKFLLSNTSPKLQNLYKSIL